MDWGNTRYILIGNESNTDGSLNKTELILSPSLIDNLFPHSRPIKGKKSGLKLTGSGGAAKHLLSRTVLRDFIGLESLAGGTKAALLDFAFHIARGNTDEAYAAVSKNITSKTVWENLARMCVKTRRLDVVQKCVGQLGNVRAAAALRGGLVQNTQTGVSFADLSDDVKLASVAAHLGMLTDAEELYSKAGRWDLLNLFYQASGEWQKALEVAEQRDRIHLKTTYYNYASYLESFDAREAMKYYRYAGTELPDCTRLLMLQNDAK